MLSVMTPYEEAGLPQLELKWLLNLCSNQRKYISLKGPFSRQARLKLDMPAVFCWGLTHAQSVGRQTSAELLSTLSSSLSSPQPRVAFSDKRFLVPIQLPRQDQRMWSHTQSGVRPLTSPTSLWAVSFPQGSGFWEPCESTQGLWRQNQNQDGVYRSLCFTLFFLIVSKGFQTISKTC